MTDPYSCVVHATCVSIGGSGLLLRGPSGSGKSTMALHLMALGAGLIADDQVGIRVHDGHLVAFCPIPLRGLIEARGIGLLNANPAAEAPLKQVVDLGRVADQRLPQQKWVTFLGHTLPLHCCAGGVEMAGALMQLTRAGRHA